MKAAILTLALAIFMLGASATYVKATGGFTCDGEIRTRGLGLGGFSHYSITLRCT